MGSGLTKPKKGIGPASSASEDSSKAEALTPRGHPVPRVLGASPKTGVVAKQTTLKNVRKVQDVYDLKAVLGTGGYAVVWSAVHKATKKEYAVKVVKATTSATPKDDEVTVEEIKNEIEVMKKLQHSNVVYINEYFVQSGKFYIVMSWLKGGELLDALLKLGTYTVRFPAPFHTLSILGRYVFFPVFFWVENNLQVVDCVLACFRPSGSPGLRRSPPQTSR